MKKTLRLSLILLLCCSLFGCNQKEDVKETTSTSQNENQVSIHYPDDNEVAVADDIYQLKQPDSIVASVEEVMSVSIEYYDGKIESYSYMVDDDNDVTLDITIEKDCTREYALLSMAAISDTLFQIDEVESVKITLATADGEAIDSKLILRNTFYHYDSERESETKRITFYKSSPDATALEGLSGSVAMDDDVSIVENIVLELEKIDAIPKGTKVNSVFINSGVCYLDLSSEFEGTVSGVKSDMVVYSLVNSITGLSYIKSVLIVIDGELVDSYRGSIDLSKPLSFNKDIIK